VHGGTSHSRAAYQGADRRQRQSRPPRRTVRPVELIAALTGLLVIGVGVPVSLLLVPAASALDAQEALRALWASLFVVAGVLHLVRWRVTGDAHAALRGCATLCFGLLTVTTAALAPLLYPSAVTEPLTPITRTVAVVACLTLLARAGRTPVVDSSIRPLRVVAITLATAWAFLALAVATAQASAPLDLGAPVWFATECVLAVGWVACGVRATRSGVTDRTASVTWMGLALLLMSMVEVLRALAFVARPELQFFGTGVQLVVGAVVLINAANHLLHLSGAVRETAHHLSADEQAGVERRHDARSVLASLKAASLVLDRYDEKLDAPTKARLRSSFAQELDRLEAILDDCSAQPLEDFRLDAVVAACRGSVNGVSVTADLAPVRVSGRPEDLRSVIHSVLTILGRRSPERSVRVRLGGTAGGVRLVCETPAGTDAHRLQRPDRGDDPLRRLGLLVARRQMREQGGDLAVHDRADGSTAVELWLRAAAGDVPGEESVQPVEGRLDVVDLATPAQDPRVAAGLTRQDQDDIRPRHIVMPDGQVRPVVAISSYDKKSA
jgi:hypothetical protein